MQTLEEYEKETRRKKQKTCRHSYFIGKSNKTFECCDCDKILNELPSTHKLAF